jgi:chromosome partitioning protein
MAKIISFANQKGGVGKSSTTLIIGQLFSRAKLKVLFVDMDAQGSLSFSLRTVPNKGNVWDVLTKEKTVENAIQRTTFGDCLCSSPQLTGADKKLDMLGKEYLLKEALDTVSDKYDFIFIDPNPSLGIQMINSLVASDYVIIPTFAEIYSLIGISDIFSTITLIKNYCHRSDLQIAGILITKFRGNSNISREITLMIEETAKNLNTKVFSTRLREAVSVKESIARRVELYAHAPNSIATLDYIAFANELLEDLNARQKS